MARLVARPESADVMEVSNLALEDLQDQIRQAYETARNKDGAAPDPGA
ncbi:hypothetical protein [Actinomadura sp. 9N215]